MCSIALVARSVQGRCSGKVTQRDDQGQKGGAQKVEKGLEGCAPKMTSGHEMCEERKDIDYDGREWLL